MSGEKTQQKPVKRVYNMLTGSRPRPKRVWLLKSMTIPDQALSMREIMDNHTRGFEIPGNLDPIFEDPEMQSRGINPRTLDYVDLQRMQHANNETLKEARDAYQKALGLSKEKAAQKVLDDRKKQFEEWKKSLSEEEGKH